MDGWTQSFVGPVVVALCAQIRRTHHNTAHTQSAPSIVDTYVRSVLLHLLHRFPSELLSYELQLVTYAVYVPVLSFALLSALVIQSVTHVVLMELLYGGVSERKAMERELGVGNGVGVGVGNDVGVGVGNGVGVGVGNDVGVGVGNGVGVGVGVGNSVGVGLGLRAAENENEAVKPPAVHANVSVVSSSRSGFHGSVVPSATHAARTVIDREGNIVVSSDTARTTNAPTPHPVLHAPTHPPTHAPSAPTHAPGLARADGTGGICFGYFSSLSYYTSGTEAFYGMIHTCGADRWPSLSVLLVGASVFQGLLLLDMASGTDELHPLTHQHTGPCTPHSPLTPLPSPLFPHPSSLTPLISPLFPHPSSLTPLPSPLFPHIMHT